jgi:hypothetical protein
LYRRYQHYEARLLLPSKRTVVPIPDFECDGVASLVRAAWSASSGITTQAARRTPGHGLLLRLASLGLHTNGKAGAHSRAGTQTPRNAVGHRLSRLWT